MRANAREKALYVAALVEVKRRVERAHHQRKAPMKPDPPHVTLPGSDPRPHIAGLGHPSLAKVREHRGGVIDPENFDPVTRDRKRDPTVAYPVLEHGTAEALGEADVELNVIDPPSIRRRVVVSVRVVRE